MEVQPFNIGDALRCKGCGGITFTVHRNLIRCTICGATTTMGSP